MAEFFKEIKFFKERNIKDKDMNEMVAAFKLLNIEAGEDVIRYGENGNTFFVILQGIVSISIPNPKIKNWRLKRLDFMMEQEWASKLEQDYKQTKAA